MASSSFLAVVIALLLLSSNASGSDNVNEACSKTKQSKLCTDTLGSFPESKDADLAKLVDLAVSFTSSTGSKMSVGTSEAVHKAENNGMLLQCLTDCQELLIDAVDQLDTCAGAVSDKNYKDAVMVLGAAGADARSCTQECDWVKEEAEAKEMIHKSNHLYDLCDMVSDLIFSLKINS